MKENKVELIVEGMTCVNCAKSIDRFLSKKGLKEVYVNFATKEVRFDYDKNVPVESIKAGIKKLGFIVVDATTPRPFWSLEKKLVLAAVFTAPLLLHHILMMFSVSFLEVPKYAWWQFAICLPVFILGLLHFGVSGWHSLKGGVPNMDVLIFTGSTAAFIYSVIGSVLVEPNYIFYETCATIITLVLLGNLLEKRAVEQTTSSIEELGKLKTAQAVKVITTNDQERLEVVHADTLVKGDTVQVNEGDRIPADGLLLSGTATIDESMLTGESTPIYRKTREAVVGGSVVLSGNFRMEVAAAGSNTVLSSIIDLVKQAQAERPDIQRLADKISAIFVPFVLVIALLTFVVCYFLVESIGMRQALMNSIAVLVISCPCAMGLATPTAVMVGIGRVAKNGILIKGGQTLEVFAGVKNVVFDKTGTLTTGDFLIKGIQYHKVQSIKEVNEIIVALEKHSSHPIAKSIVKNLASENSNYQLSKVEELKGKGMQGIDADGNIYQIGSYALAKSITTDDQRNLYVLKNRELIATLDIQDEIKPNAKACIDYLLKNGHHPILLSGDRKEKTAQVAKELGITNYFAEKTPAEKLKIIEEFAKKAPTAMVGDGINDAPALSKATVGVSLSNASQAAIQSAQIILLNGELDYLTKALAISKATLVTIKQNLFWAFAYNIVAIPMAAMGFLSPMWGALFMAFSDVVVIGNSLRLKARDIW